MKKNISILSIVLYLLTNSLANAEEPPEELKDVALVADHKKAVGFGIWRIYNTGTTVYIIDEKDKRWIQSGWTTNDPHFWDGDFSRLLLGSGSVGELEIGLDHEYFAEVSEGLAAPISKQLADGIYSFGDKRFEVKGDHLAVYNRGARNGEELPTPGAIINKYSNGLLHNGMEMQHTIEPSVVLDANSVSTPTLIEGDCLATYSAETGLVNIPCLNLIGGSNNTIYQVKQHQIPGSLTFEVNENTDVSRVQ